MMTSQKKLSKTKMTKETLLPSLAAHVLAQGLAGASLRPLAKAAGTSDRMLIYHFGNKEALINDLLDYIAEVYAATLDAGMGDERAATRYELVKRVLARLDEPSLRPFLALWWDIVAGSVRGNSGHKDAAKRMMHKLLQWVEDNMPEGDPDPKGGARYLLTLIEGSHMLSSVGHARTANEGLLASNLSQD